MKEKLKEIVDSYQKVHKSGLNLSYVRFDENKGSELSILNDFRNGLRQASMFKEKKLAILINPLSNSIFKTEFLKNVDDFIKSEDLIVLAEEKELAKNDKLLKVLKEKAKCQEFELFTGVKLKKWAENEFEKYKAKIEALALNNLLIATGNDLWQLSQEIKKLSCYKKSGEINCNDVSLLVRSKIENDIFKTIDAIAIKDKKQALKLMHKHMESGDSPLYILSMINYQFRNLLTIKDLMEKGTAYGDIAQKSGLHPFVIRKSYQQLSQFTFNDLKKIYLKIFKVDFDIKTGKTDPASAIDLLVAEI